MTDFLGTAVEGNWLLKIKCERRRAGLKSTRPCPVPTVVQAQALLAVLTPTISLEELAGLVHCPQCGCRHVTLTWIVPPAPPPVPPTPPKMKPLDPREIDLRSYSGERIIVACIRCRRRGKYRTASVVERLGPDTYMTEVAHRIAESRGCKRARNDLLTSPEIRDCGAHLDVASGPWIDAPD